MGCTSMLRINPVALRAAHGWAARGCCVLIRSRTVQPMDGLHVNAANRYGCALCSRRMGRTGCGESVAVTHCAAYGCLTCVSRSPTVQPTDGQHMYAKNQSRTAQQAYYCLSQCSQHAPWVSQDSGVMACRCVLDRRQCHSYVRLPARLRLPAVDCGGL